MEIVVELVLELVGPLVSAAVGLVLGTVALLTMLGVRRVLARVSRSSEVQDPVGDLWSVRVVYGLRRPAGTRLARMRPADRAARRRSGRVDASVDRNEIWHPKGLLDAFDDAAGLVAPFVLVAAAAITVLVVIELLIALPIGLVFVAYSLLRGRWQVEVIDPKGGRSVLDATSLGEARTSAQHATQRVRAGLPG